MPTPPPSPLTWAQQQDLQHCWHPFTDQAQWEKQPPLILTKAKGVWLYDEHDNRYFDGNSSIWTNIHGHSHPTIVEAIQRQAATLSHSSYLGFGNDQACELAHRLCAFFPKDTLSRCFFSDNGSTALEVALKTSLQFRECLGEPQRDGIITFSKAYHGDTLGAASIGGVSRFVRGYAQKGLTVHRVDDLDSVFSLPPEVVKTCSALVIEPLIQGVNQMRLWPPGMLAQLRKWTKKHHIHLILDEVMTGFGRTGTMFACQQENVTPDFLCLAKGLTGGAMPLAATLIQDEIYQTFKTANQTLFYGHSYTANPLGCAAALANLNVFDQENTLQFLEEKGTFLQNRLQPLNPRRLGLILAFETDNAPEICATLRRKGVLTRPILDTIVLMPPLASTIEELTFLADATLQATKT